MVKLVVRYSQSALSTSSALASKIVGSHGEGGKVEEATKIAVLKYLLSNRSPISTTVVYHANSSPSSSP